jgi:hypothetical protein
MSTVMSEKINGNNGRLGLVNNDAILNAALAEVEMQERMFELAQRKAKIYSESTLVPKEYQKSIGNVLIAENIARRVGADVLMVMQNLYVVHGRPGWSSVFLIGSFNTCGRFEAIRYKMEGIPGQPGSSCVAYTKEKATGDVIEGTRITWELAKAEGWVEKGGSKWKTMPEQMFRYRAASWLIRATAPEIGLGLYTREELEDISEPATSQRISPTSLDEISVRLEVPVNSAASPAQDAMDDRSIVFAKYQTDVAACVDQIPVTKLYDATFGPESTIDWSPEENELAAQIAEDRREAIRKSRAK